MTPHPFRRLKRLMPERLYERSLIIIVAPMVVLQAVVAYIFMERHWEKVTRRLSGSVVGEIALLLDMHAARPDAAMREFITDEAAQDLGFRVSFRDSGVLPKAGPAPLFSLLDRSLARSIAERIGRPFWLDTVSNDDFVDIRILAPGEQVMRVLAPRSRVYATNSQIFIIWMIAASLVLIAVAVLFLRGQIRPIQRLARAVDDLGKGRGVPDFKPSGAWEVRRAGEMFLQMKARIERQMTQRTQMLSGVSHDMGTLLARFKLQLAMLPPGPDAAELRRDVEEMEHILQSFLDFAHNNAGEQTQSVDVGGLLEEVRAGALRKWRGKTRIDVRTRDGLTAALQRNALKRCLTNLVDNACQHASRVRLEAHCGQAGLDITVDDNGKGIPAARHEEAFRPFHRLDAARNQDHAGTGLGLAVARDIARNHGGDIHLSCGGMGGLQATVHLPS